ncbi:hypothetical protein LX32DRAFT_641632 [Colletotrichum zoysiae]|uniref:Uncharacterized protein n=1 Tax=Colletotrichum zoysiae TaxID=1216348 RepID=A0AAD9HEA5_9PEZI|nr:hypothetical protein LX32DRAFT_641632 [Colletotrichum zoysiae]
MREVYMTQQVRQLGGAGTVLAFAWAAVQSARRAALFPLDKAKVKGVINPGRWWQAWKGGVGRGWEVKKG